MRSRHNLYFAAVVCGTVAITAAWQAHAEDLSDRLSGRMLLQVERHGEAWWVNPDSRERIYLDRPATALDIMRRHGIGISNADIRRIPIGLLDLDSQDQDGDGLHDTLKDSLGLNRSQPDTDDDGVDDRAEILAGQDPNGLDPMPHDPAFAAAQAGRIFLQVESRGEAWWVNPNDLKRYYLGRAAEAFAVMRGFGIGVSDADLARIRVMVATDSVTPPSTDAPAAAPPPQSVPENKDDNLSGPQLPILDSTDYSDCGSDMGCLVTAAESGRAALATQHATIDDGLLDVTADLRHKVAVTTGGRPVLITETLAAEAGLSDTAADQLKGAGYDAAQADDLKNRVVSAVPLTAGNVDWCIFSSQTRLAQTLRHWRDGVPTQADLDYASCCSLRPDGSVDPRRCDEDFPVTDRCLLTVHPSAELKVGDQPDEWVTRYAGLATEVTWSTSDPTIVSLRESSGDAVTVMARRPGSARITVTDGGSPTGCRVSYEITVRD
jgi:hypothetical protein